MNCLLVRGTHRRGTPGEGIAGQVHNSCSLRLRNLPSLFRSCCQRYGLSPGDLPAIEPFQAALAEIPDLKAFPKLDKKLLAEMDNMFAVEIPKLLEKAARSPV